MSEPMGIGRRVAVAFAGVVAVAAMAGGAWYGYFAVTDHAEFLGAFKTLCEAGGHDDVFGHPLGQGPLGAGGAQAVGHHGEQRALDIEAQGVAHNAEGKVVFIEGALPGEQVQVGDYVIVHVGHAIGVLDAEEAERTLVLFAEMAAQQAREAAE